MPTPEETVRRIDPEGICAHDRVKRLTDDSGDRYINKWECEACGQQFMPGDPEKGFKFGFTGYKELPDVETPLPELTFLEKTLRDEFAMRAMEGMISIDKYRHDQTAQEAYRYADAMIAARRIK